MKFFKALFGLALGFAVWLGLLALIIQVAGEGPGATAGAAVALFAGSIVTGVWVRLPTRWLILVCPGLYWWPAALVWDPTPVGAQDVLIFVCSTIVSFLGVKTGVLLGRRLFVVRDDSPEVDTKGDYGGRCSGDYGGRCLQIIQTWYQEKNIVRGITKPCREEPDWIRRGRCTM